MDLLPSINEKYGPELVADSTRSGWIYKLPISWVPYAQLMRLERPAGFYAFYFPYLIGLAYAASLAHYPVPWRIFSTMAGLGFIWSIMLRGAVCTWNDNIDQDFDRKVERCPSRPIARGAISTIQGHVFTLAQGLCCGALLLAFPPECSLDAATMTGLFLIYPFGKRFTYYPQLILGFPFATAIFMAFHALKVDPWSTELLPPTVCLYLSNIMWTMIYDTIYAHQDIGDDVKAGVKSMAVRFKDTTKQIVSFLAVVQVSLLAIVGYLLELGPLFYLVTCGGVASALGAMIVLVDLSKPHSCAWWFKADFWFVGGVLFIERFGAYILQKIS